MMSFADYAQLFKTLCLPEAATVQKRLDRCDLFLQILEHLRRRYRLVV